MAGSTNNDNSYYQNHLLSESKPTADDLLLDQSLIGCLKEFDIFETEEENRARLTILGKLNELVKDWIRDVTTKKNLSDLINDANGKIYTMGSYRLGVHQRGADIDILVVGPAHVTFDDFFSSFYEMLKKRPEVPSIVPVTDASTPIIKMEFSGVEIDLQYASLPLSTIPENIKLSDINLLRNFQPYTHDKVIRSLNGPRVADELLNLVPNHETYRMALSAVKVWAKRRGIYANIMGFLGGVAFALLTARICQFYPYASSSTIFVKFFRVYSEWQWPYPVTLKPIEDLNLGFRIWNPKEYPSDHSHLMPVITPVYPCMNSTYNVTYSTLSTMKEEFERANNICQDIVQKKRDWKVLFEKSDFFYRYKLYLQLQVYATNNDDFQIWKGYMESRIRTFIIFLEQSPAANVETATPYPDSYPIPSSELPPVATTDENGNESSSQQENETPPATFQFGCAFFLGLKIKNTNQNEDESKKQQIAMDLSEALADFTVEVNKWGKTNANMGFSMKHLFKRQLPECCFEGEPRKVKKRKRAADKPGDPSSKKKKASLESTSTSTLVSASTPNLPKPSSSLLAAGPPGLNSISASNLPAMTSISKPTGEPGIASTTTTTSNSGPPGLGIPAPTTTTTTTS